MDIVNFRSLLRSFRYAGKGIRHVFLHEQNFRLQIVATIVVLVLVITLKVSRGDFVVLLLLIGIILILEILNSAVEVIIDLLKPRLHFYAEVIKDMMAAAVFLASTLALLIGILIFLPYAVRLLAR